MLDIEFTLKYNVDKFILETFNKWKKYGFKDIGLWETFQKDFESFTEEDFRLASSYNI